MGLTPISKEENKRPGPREKFLNLLWGNVPWGLLHHHPSLSRWPRNKNNLMPEKILETFEGNQWKKENDRSSGKQDNNGPDCWRWFDQFQMSEVFTADCLKVVMCFPSFIQPPLHPFLEHITHSKQIPQLWTNFVICVEDFNCTFKGCWCDDAGCLRKLWWWFFETSSLSFLEYCAGRLVRWNKKVEAHRGSGNMISQSPLAASTHLTDTDRKTGMHHHHHHQHHHLPHHHHQYHHCHSRYRHIVIIITVITTGGTEQQWP